MSSPIMDDHNFVNVAELASECVIAKYRNPTPELEVFLRNKPSPITITGDTAQQAWNQLRQVVQASYGEDQQRSRSRAAGSQ